MKDNEVISIKEMTDSNDDLVNYIKNEMQTTVDTAKRGDNVLAFPNNKTFCARYEMD